MTSSTVMGKGTFGTVSRGFDKLLQKEVAIKRDNEEALSMAHVRERRTFMECVDVPNVVQLLDVCDDSSGMPVLFLECMEEDLRRHLLRVGPMRTPSACSLVQDILKGVEHLHTGGFFHRDLKPSNCLVANGTVKIADFGTVKAHLPGRKNSLDVCTLWYNCLDVLLADGNYTPKVDLWSIGCIYGELRSGQALFPGSDNYDQARLILKHTGIPSEGYPLHHENFDPASFPRTHVPVTTWEGVEEDVALLEVLLALDPAKRSLTRALELTKHMSSKKDASPGTCSPKPSKPKCSSGTNRSKRDRIPYPNLRRCLRSRMHDANVESERTKVICKLERRMRRLKLEFFYTCFGMAVQMLDILLRKGRVELQDLGAAGLAAAIVAVKLEERHDVHMSWWMDLATNLVPHTCGKKRVMHWVKQVCTCIPRREDVIVYGLHPHLGEKGEECGPLLVRCLKNVHYADFEPAVLVSGILDACHIRQEQNLEHGSKHVSEHTSEHGSEHTSEHVSEHVSEPSEHGSKHTSENVSEHGSASTTWVKNSSRVNDFLVKMWEEDVS